MFQGHKHLKDSSPGPSLFIKDAPISISYKKTNKLITALYMVTDVMDAGEPLRMKLRTLGTGIISDMYFTPANVCQKVSEIMSFLDIVLAMNLVSEMNCNILRKEFQELDQSVRDLLGQKEGREQVDLAAFLQDKTVPGTKKYRSIGHRPARLGVQSGATLMKALSDSKFLSSVKKSDNPEGGSSMSDRNNPEVYNFDLFKKQRRDNILNIVKVIEGGAAIKDIKDKVAGTPDQYPFLVSCGEKTLQRELVAMVKDGILSKKGEKRWSRYSVASSL